MHAHLHFIPSSSLLLWIKLWLSDRLIIYFCSLGDALHWVKMIHRSNIKLAAIVGISFSVASLIVHLYLANFSSSEYLYYRRSFDGFYGSVMYISLIFTFNWLVFSFKKPYKIYSCCFWNLLKYSEECLASIYTFYFLI